MLATRNLPAAAPFARHLGALPPIVQCLALAGVYCLLHGVLSGYSRYFFYLPTGLTFALLLMVPVRLWPWLLAAEWLCRLLIEIKYSPGQFPWALLAVIPQPLGPYLALAWLRWRGRTVDLNRSIDMARMLAAMVITAVWVGLAGVVLVRVAPHYLFMDISYTALALGLFLGNLTGMLLIAPTVIAGYSIRLPLPRWLLLEALIGLALPALALVYLRDADSGSFLHQFGRALSIAPPVYFAWRHGWRGAAIAITVVGLASIPVHLPHYTPPDEAIVAQMMLVIVAAAALLLGSAMDSQRASTVALQQRKHELERLGRSLRESAQRNLRLEEEQRRRLVADLHDELGQGITALHTRIKLMEPVLAPAGPGDTIQAVYGMLGDMRRTVRQLSDSLRPAVLDEFGLLRALREGPLSELLDQAGMRLSFDLQGEPALLEALDADTQLAVWRIIQEAVTNSVRHARASRFTIKLRVGLRNDDVWLLVDLRDDGRGIEPSAVGSGFGLQGIRDRALALSGTMAVNNTKPGTRIHVLLRQPLPGDNPAAAPSSQHDAERHRPDPGSPPE